MQTVRKILDRDGSSAVTLDPQLLRNFGWKPGDYVIIEDNKDHLEIYRLDLSKAKGGQNDRST